MANQPARRGATIATTERFWERVDVRGPDECWEWRGCRNRPGYGMVTNCFGSKLTHRVAWTLRRGVIPEGMCVLHKCDNPPCCNPAHLFLGTRTDNQRDMQRKGRLVIPRGEKHGEAKLTTATVRAIRAAYARGDTQVRIARRFAINQGHVSAIVRRASWKHVL